MSQVEKYLNECFNFEAINNKIKSHIDHSLPDMKSYLQFLVDYAEFNYVFAGCVSGLAGRFHVSPSVENCPVLHKVSHLVAQHVFEAAVDEYKGVTHKAMANTMVKHVCRWFDQTDTPKPSPMLKRVLREVREGYGIINECTFSELSFNLGFHIASEQLASFEFTYLNEKAKRDDKVFYDFMNGENMEDQYNFRPWLWVEIHGEVEDEHADYAFRAADFILNELEGEDRITFLNDIKYGFEMFMKVQESFFKVTSKAELA